MFLYFIRLVEIFPAISFPSDTFFDSFRIHVVHIVKFNPLPHSFEETNSLTAGNDNDRLQY
jgi:hypothetical protein